MLADAVDLFVFGRWFRSKGAPGSGGMAFKVGIKLSGMIRFLGALELRLGSLYADQSKLVDGGSVADIRTPCDGVEGAVIGMAALPEFACSLFESR
jgi:hypothetical protein